MDINNRMAHDAQEFLLGTKGEHKRPGNGVFLFLSV